MKTLIKIVLLLLLALTFLGCMASQPQVSIWPSRASENGKWNAFRIFDFQHGESVMICVNHSIYGGKAATVKIINVNTGKLMSKRSDFLKSDRTYFYTVHELPPDSYIATVSTEDLIRATTHFNVN